MDFKISLPTKHFSKTLLIEEYKMWISLNTHAGKECKVSKRTYNLLTVLNNLEVLQSIYLMKSFPIFGFDGMMKKWIGCIIINPIKHVTILQFIRT